MSRLHSLFPRLRALIRKSRLEREMDEELLFHLERQIEDNIKAGMTAEEARYAALRAFGGVEQLKEECRDLQRTRFIEEFWQDLRFGLRLLRRSPGFTAAVVLTLALGIGANTAMFSVVHALLIEPLPYRNAELLVVLSARNPAGARIAFSYPDFLDLKTQTRVFENLAAYQDWGFTLTGAGEAARLPGRNVSAEFFSTLGVALQLGRDFRPEDDRAGAHPVAILSHQAWQRYFHTEPQIIGQDVTFNGRSFTIIGVLPASFQFYLSGDVFAPIGLGLRPSARGQRRGIHAIGRLRSGATLAQAQAEADTIVRQLAQQYSATNAGIGAQLVPLAESIVGETKPIVLILLGAVCFVLLIACVNVANLLLARAATRQKEYALRISLGAKQSRLLRQMLTESVLLAVTGGAVGLLLSAWSMRAINLLLPDSIQRLKEISVNGSVLGFTLLLSAMTGLLFGLVPAWHTLRRESLGDVHTRLKEGGRGTVAGWGRHSLRWVLVMSEVALSLVLLVGAGLMIRTLLSLQNVNPGFRVANVFRTQIVLPQAEYTPDRQVTFFTQLMERTRSLPAVEAASMVMCLPLSGGCWAAPVEIEGRSIPADHEQSEINFNSVMPDYFRTMGIPVLKGRDFDRRDSGATLAVVIISQGFARHYFADENPIGKRVRERSSGANVAWATVIGVVGDVRRYGLDATVTAEVYRPFTQKPVNFMTVVAHTPGNPLALSAAVRSELSSLDKNLPLPGIGTMEQLHAKGVATRRFPAVLLALFASIALVLATVGVYGVIAYSVAQRTSEIGIRMALGAKRSDVVWLIVSEGMSAARVGVLVGLLAALALTRTLTSVLYGVSATDPLTFAVVALTLVCIALLACAIPARRASRVDPMVALRHE